MACCTHIWRAGAAAALVLVPSDAGLGADVLYIRAGGSDGADGRSPDSAWRTLSRAVFSVQPGDTVYIGAGEYRESVRMLGLGSAVTPIRFVADAAGDYTGDKGPVVISPPRGRPALHMTGTTGVNWHGVHVRAVDANAVELHGVRGCELRRIEVEGGQCGVEVVGGEVELRECMVSSPKRDGVAIRSGLLLQSKVTLDRCEVRGAGDDGVAIRNHSTVTIVSSTIEACGGVGVAAAVLLPTIRVDRTTIRHCHYGVRLLDVGSLQAVNCLIHSNRIHGVSLEVHGIEAAIVNCTIADMGYDGLHVLVGTAQITNCILADNGGYGLRVGVALIAQRANLMHGNRRGAVAGLLTTRPQYTLNPKFVAPGSDYRLLAGSPAIDAGVNTLDVAPVDLTGAPRPHGGFWDLGCYEWGAITPSPRRILCWEEVEPD